MGRVIGDGGWYFHIADMATLPELQGRGLGRRVLADLLVQIDESAPPGAYITLLADAPGRRLYESVGFVLPITCDGTREGCSHPSVPRVPTVSERIRGRSTGHPVPPGL